MSDFFADLRQDLDRSARRRARIRRTRPVVTAMAVAAIAVVVATSVASIDFTRDQEVAVPPPVPAGGCRSDDPPPEIADRFSVFEDEVVYEGHRAPKEIADRATGDLPGGPMAKVWTEYGRRATQDLDVKYWVFPALAGSCMDPEPAVCVVQEQGAVTLPTCVAVGEIGRGSAIGEGRLEDGRWFFSVLVPDETEQHEVRLFGVDEYFTDETPLDNNIWIAHYEATEREREGVELEFKPNPPARLGSDREIPATQADGSPWPDVPTALEAAIDGKVLLATAVSEEVVKASGCKQGADNPFVGANVDEYSMTATYRFVGEIAGEPGTPAVYGCAATWHAQRRQWRDRPCNHYAPAKDAEAVTRSGGGMIYCDEIAAVKVLMIWIAPPAGTRWIVVRRGRTYFVAYPVVAGEPVRVTYPIEDATPKDNFQTLRYEAVTESGTVTQHEVLGAVAG